MEKIILEDFSKNLIPKINKILEDITSPEKIRIVIDDIRSLPQNQLFHAWVRLICSTTGEDDIERMKRIIKKSLGYYEDIVEGGERYRIFQSTADMSKAEFQDFTLKLSVWAYDNCNCTLPPFKQTKKINIKLSNND